MGKKDLLYEKFKDRCADNGITGEEGGDIEMCWIIARDILTQERKQELDRARKEGRKYALKEVEYTLAKDERYEFLFTEIKDILSKLKTK